MRTAYLLAHPAGHSISPAMHDAAFAASGLAHRYLALDVAPDGLEQAVAALRDPAVLGANVTIPHKETVAAYLDQLTPAARSIGAVNTIVPTARGLEGDNTDADGFLAALAEIGLAPAGLDCVVLGAGGAARAVVWALAQAGATVRISNRSMERASSLRATMTAYGQVEVLAVGELEGAVRESELLVNATSVGMREAGAPTQRSPLPDAWLPRHGAVVDLVYRPSETPLLWSARRAGLTVQNGLPMLVLQGAASFQRWLERPAPVAVMRRAAEAALRADD